jgi:hypothetical protein
MRLYPFKAFMAASDLSVENLKALRRRDHVALAFGRRDAYASLKYLEIDPVAVLLADKLAPPFGRSVAAQMVRMHCDQWAQVVAVAETTKTPAYFWVCEFEKDGKRSHLVAGATTSDVNQIRQAMQPQARDYQFSQAIPVDITGIIARVRANTKSAGFDYSDPFLPAPDSKAFKEIFQPYTEIRDRAVATFKDQADQARRAGLLARAKVEASIHA